MCLVADNKLLLFKTETPIGLLSIWQDNKYRWMTLGGDLEQGKMMLSDPSDPVTPMSSAMVRCIESLKYKNNILNLGLGTASLERALINSPDTCITSVEVSQAVIDCCYQYFALPQSRTIYCQDAFEYLRDKSNNTPFDVVIMDLFGNEKEPVAYQHDKTFKQVKQRLTNNGVLIINSHCQNNQEVKARIQTIHQALSNILVVEFNSLNNLLFIASNAELNSLYQKLQPTDAMIKNLHLIN